MVSFNSPYNGGIGLAPLSFSDGVRPNTKIQKRLSDYWNRYYSAEKIKKY